MDNVSALARDWIEAKKQEAEANKRRVKIEEQLIGALGAKDEGSITHELDEYKVTLTQPVARKVDVKAWEIVKNNIPHELWPIKTKVDVDATGIKWLKESEPKLWKAVSRAFTEKPGKIGVKVEAVS